MASYVFDCVLGGGSAAVDKSNGIGGISRGAFSSCVNNDITDAYSIGQASGKSSCVARNR